HGNSDAGADRDLVAFDRVDLAERLDDALGESRHTLPPGTRRLQNDKLVAAEARDEIGTAHGVAKPVRDLTQKRVAARMAEGIVDLLELVEIDEQDGARDARFAAGETALEFGGERCPVGQSGQRVEARKML